MHNEGEVIPTLTIVLMVSQPRQPKLAVLGQCTLRTNTKTLIIGRDHAADQMYSGIKLTFAQLEGIL